MIESAVAVQVNGLHFSLYEVTKLSIFFVNSLTLLNEPRGGSPCPRDDREETLHLIEPAGVGWNEVHVPAWSLREPRSHLRVLVARVVVHDAMDVQLLRHCLVDLAQEREKFLMPVARLAAGQNRAVEHIERREQRRSSVADIVVGDAFSVTKSHRQHRLRAFQSLALALLVNAEHQRVFRGIQV
jgi:hypothetical protein